MKSNTVKLSPYERAINRLNDLPLALDKIFSEALEDLRRQRDEAIIDLKKVKQELLMVQQVRDEVRDRLSAYREKTQWIVERLDYQGHEKASVFVEESIRDLEIKIGTKPKLG